MGQDNQQNLDDLAARYVIAGGNEKTARFLPTPEQKIIMNEMFDSYSVTPIQIAVK